MTRNSLLWLPHPSRYHYKADTRFWNLMDKQKEVWMRIHPGWRSHLGLVNLISYHDHFCHKKNCCHPHLWFHLRGTEPDNVNQTRPIGEPVASLGADHYPLLVFHIAAMRQQKEAQKQARVNSAQWKNWLRAQGPSNVFSVLSVAVNNVHWKE